MRKFRFKLSGLLTLREMHEDAKAELLRMALQREKSLEEALVMATGNTEMSRAKLENLGGASVTAANYVSALADFEKKLAEERSAESELQRQRQTVQAARDAWSVAAMDVKTVQKLKDKASDLHMKVIRHKEQIQNDEAGARFSGTAFSIVP